MPERFGLDVPPHARRPVAWYALGQLWRIAREQLWSLNLLRNLDRRETFTSEFDLVPVGEPDAAGDYWVDFVADTGDGGCATTAVAQGLLAPRLQPAGLPAAHAAGLPAAQLLLLGGDLAYPGASPAHYQARFIEPFELARPQAEPARGRRVAAIPQNHDWFDSLSTFCRYFVNSHKAGLLGAEAPQTRSYFAFALPHRWFVLGFDFALAGDLDRGQFDLFAGLLRRERIPAGSQLLLIYPEPYWTRRLGDGSDPAYPKRYQRLEWLLLQHGCAIRARLAGDLHHYVRESLPAAALGTGSELITCGSGGAFGHATHAREVSERKHLQLGEDERAAQRELRGRVFVGRAPARPGPGEVVHDFAEQKVCWPSPAASRRRALLNVFALLRPANLVFAGAIGLAHALAVALWPSHPWAAALALLVPAGAAVTVALENDPARAPLADWPLAALLLALQGALFAGGLALAPRLPGGAAGFALGAAAAVVASALAFGGFLALASALFGRLPNNASSALPGEHHKGFLRLRLHAGGLEAFMIGLDDVPTRWRRSSTGWPYWAPWDGKPLAWRVIDHFHLPHPEP